MSHLKRHERDDGVSTLGDHFKSSKKIKGNLFNDISEDSAPLGLSLKKSASLVDLIQKTVYGETMDSDSITSKREMEKEKIKASNFPASSIKIGSWEKISVNEGNVVSKYYFAKRKLVWEILECKLKRKIEILWFDIAAIRATFEENKCSVLEIELKKPPAFFEEKDPQPKKHTLWNPTADFTGGQASIYRIHRLEFPEGTLRKHYEKLIAYDKHMQLLSKKPFPCSDSPLFPLTNDCLSNMNLFGLDFLPAFNQPFRNPMLSHSNAFVTNPNPFSYKSQDMQGNIVNTINHLKLPSIPPNPFMANSGLSISGFLPARHVQNFRNVGTYNSIFNTSPFSQPLISPTSVIDPYQFGEPAVNNKSFTTTAFSEPNGKKLPKSVPGVPRLDSYAAESNQSWQNLGTEKIYGSFISEPKKLNICTVNFGSHNSSAWELDDIMDHLFNDGPAPVKPDDGLIKKIRSFDAHLNKLPEMVPDAECPGC